MNNLRSRILQQRGKKKGGGGANDDGGGGEDDDIDGVESSDKQYHK